MFDGINVWVTSDIPGGSVVELRASDGSFAGSFSLGSYPVGAAFDGANIWVANSGSNTVTEIRVSDGSETSATVQLRSSEPAMAPT